jgi:protein-disulfide isomerase
MRKSSIFNSAQPGLLLACLLVTVCFLSFASVAFSSNDPYLALKKDDVVFGNPRAKHTVVEYFSLTCFHCAVFYEKIFPQLKEEFIDTGKVKWIKRVFVSDQRAMKASMLLECKKQNADGYKKFLSVLLAKQEAWVTGKNYIDVLQNLAKLSGMKKSEIDACFVNEELGKILTEQTVNASKKLGIKGTPSFFFNGVYVEDGITVEKINLLIKKSESVH